MTVTAPRPTLPQDVNPREMARRSLRNMFFNPYMLLVAALTVLALVLPFFDGKGMIASLFILAICAGLRLAYTTRQAIRDQTQATLEQTTAIKASNDMLYLAVTSKTVKPTDEQG